VPDDQLALAIGKEGMNARLAARLTGWKVDIKSDTEFATEEAEAAYAGDGGDEEFTGRCAAILSTGKRCPNAALPGSHYCGVPAHQELAKKEAEQPAKAPAEERVAEEAPPAEEPVAEEQPETVEPAPDEPVAEEPVAEEPEAEEQPEVEEEPAPEPEAEKPAPAEERREDETAA